MKPIVSIGIAKQWRVQPEEPISRNQQIRQYTNSRRHRGPRVTHFAQPNAANPVTFDE